MWFDLTIGVGLGVALTIPLVWLASRRTEQRVRRAEQQARANERLAEVGSMTAGLAHEIKNPLSSVGLNIQLLQEDLIDLRKAAEPESDEEVALGRFQRRFDSLGRETERLKDILEDFLRFAGRMKLQKQPTNLNDVVDDLTDFFTPQAEAAGVRIHAQLDPRLAHASVDASLLKQALLNLMINAVQAMAAARDKKEPHGGCGELILRTRPAGSYVEIHVTDTGPGIPEDARDKVFQPYFSTKRSGTGLGLPTTRRIIEEHGGNLLLVSSTGKGTDFIIRLPIGDASPSRSGGTGLSGSSGSGAPLRS